jgi:hypothetical protein
MWFVHRLLLAGYFLAYPTTLEMKTVGSSEMAVNFYRGIRRHIQDDDPLKTNVLSGSKDITFKRNL